MIKHSNRKVQGRPDTRAKLQADRARYQRDKPTPEQLLAEGGHQNFIALGDLIALEELVRQLKREREHQGLTLAQVSAKAGIDEAALSRLESGKNLNPTLTTLFRIARALGKEVLCHVQGAAKGRARGKARKRRLGA